MFFAWVAFGVLILGALGAFIVDEWNVVDEWNEPQ